MPPTGLAAASGSRGTLTTPLAAGLTIEPLVLSRPPGGIAAIRMRMPTAPPRLAIGIGIVLPCRFPGAVR